MTRAARAFSVALVAAASLSYEVLLVRTFAIEYFHHFAYMAIGVAMLGFGAAGTLLALAGNPSADARVRWFAHGGWITAVSLIVAPALADLIALDPTQTVFDPNEWWRLAVVYVLLAVPFASAAIMILVGLTLEPDRPGHLYGASFIGSGVGAFIALAVSWFLFPERALAVPAILAAVAGVTGARAYPSVPLCRSIAWTVVAASLLTLWLPPWRVDVTPYKGLPQVLAYPDAQRIAEHTSPLGWVVAVQSPAFRYAPGLSLAYRGDFPNQTALFLDGQLAGAATDWESVPGSADIVNWLPTALPFALGPRRRVLVIGAGGGLEVRNAEQHGADTVVALELHPDLVVPVETPGTTATIEWVIGDARNYAARTSRAFDLITLGAGGGFGTSAAGVHSLNEDFLHTVEAYVAFLNRLDPDGVLAVTRWLMIPPRAGVRVILTAAEALRRTSPDHVSDGLIVARGWATTTVLVKPSGFTAADVGAVQDWATQRQFDIDWRPGLESPESRYHLLEEPVFFMASKAASSSREDATAFGKDYRFEIDPATDTRPYPHHYLRAGSLPTFVATSRSNWLPFAEWGYLALVATLIQSVVVAGLLLVVPAAVAAGRIRRSSMPMLVGYFGAIGVAYMAAEIAALQQLGLLLGHPVYAVALVLSTFLISSGVGSVLSDRVQAASAWLLLSALAVALAGYAVALTGFIHLLQAEALPVRVAAGIVAVVPAAILMGFPFPLGLRLLRGLGRGRGQTTRQLAWAWASNGFASVVATPFAALVALEAGSRAVFVVAAVAYALAALIQRRSLAVA